MSQIFFCVISLLSRKFYLTIPKRQFLQVKQNCPSLRMFFFHHHFCQWNYHFRVKVLSLAYYDLYYCHYSHFLSLFPLFIVGLLPCLSYCLLTLNSITSIFLLTHFNRCLLVCFTAVPMLLSS